MPNAPMPAAAPGLPLARRSALADAPLLGTHPERRAETGKAIAPQPPLAASPDLSRRVTVAAALTGLAGLAARPARALPAAVTPGLSAVIAAFRQRCADWRAAFDGESAALGRYEEPVLPVWRPMRDSGACLTLPAGPGRVRQYCDPSDENIERLRALACLGAPLPSSEPFRAEQMRRARDELARLEAWRALDAERRAASGLDDAEARSERAALAREAALSALAAHPVATLDDARAKARCLLDTGAAAELGSDALAALLRSIASPTDPAGGGGTLA